MSSCHGSTHTHYFPAPTYDQVWDKVLINYGEHSPTIESMREGVAQDIRWEYSLKDKQWDVIKVDQNVTIQIPSINLARTIWEEYRFTHQVCSHLFTFGGLAALLSGTWRSYTQKSVVWALGTAAISFLAWRLRQAMQVGIANATTNVNKLKQCLDDQHQPAQLINAIAKFRQILIDNGLTSFKEAEEAVKTYLEDRPCIIFLTGEELSVLMLEWLNGLPIQQGSQLAKAIFTSDVMQWVIESKQATKSNYIILLETVMRLQYEPIKKTISDTIDSISSTWETMFEDFVKADPDNRNTALLAQRFKEAIQQNKYQMTEESYDAWMDECFMEQLTLFRTQLAQVVTNTKVDKASNSMDEPISNVTTAYFKDIFAKVFTAEDSVEYVENARDLFNALPHTNRHKKYLLARLALI